MEKEKILAEEQQKRAEIEAQQEFTERFRKEKEEIDKKSRENGKNNTTAINELVDENVTNVTE